MLHNHAFCPADTTRKERERRARKMPMEAPARPMRGIADRLVEASIYAIGLIVCGTLAYVVLP